MRKTSCFNCLAEGGKEGRKEGKKEGRKGGELTPIVCKEESSLRGFRPAFFGIDEMNRSCGHDYHFQRLG